MRNEDLKLYAIDGLGLLVCTRCPPDNNDNTTAPQEMHEALRWVVDHDQTHHSGWEAGAKDHEFPRVDKTPVYRR